MKEEHRFYINGEWVKSSSSELIEIENPSSEEITGTILTGQGKPFSVFTPFKKKWIESFSTASSY